MALHVQKGDATLLPSPALPAPGIAMPAGPVTATAVTGPTDLLTKEELTPEAGITPSPAVRIPLRRTDPGVGTVAAMAATGPRARVGMRLPLVRSRAAEQSVDGILPVIRRVRSRIEPDRVRVAHAFLCLPRSSEMTYEEDEDDAMGNMPSSPLEFSKEEISVLPIPHSHPFARCDSVGFSSDSDDFLWDSDSDDLPL